MRPWPALARAAIRRVAGADLLAAALSCVLLALAVRAAEGTGPIADLHYRVWTTEDGLPQGSVRGIVQTPDGYIWIATLDGLVRFDGVRMTVFANADVPEMASNRCVSLYVDRHGTLWVGTEDGGIVQRQGTRFRAFGRASGLGSDIIVGALAEDGEGRLWAPTGAGPFVFDGERWHPAPPTVRPPQPMAAPSGIPAVPVARRLPQRGSIWARGAGGRVWVLDGGHLHRRDGSQWHTFPTSVPAVIGSKPTILFEDREGTLWIGSESGLAQARPTAVRAVVPEGGGPDRRNVYTVAEDAAGRVWITTQSDPLLWDGHSLKLLRHETWWPRPWVTTIEPDTDGGVLASGPGHVFKVWPGRGFESLAGSHHAMDFLRDRAGRLWIATVTGLWKATASGWERIEGLPSDDVKVLLESRDGAIWAGTSGGLARVGDTVTTWTQSQGLSSQRIRALHEDETGALWIGTYDGGLNRFSGGRFVVIRKRDGLCDDGVFTILDDRDGRYWMSSNRGVYSVARRDLDRFASGGSRTIACRAWNRHDGMPSSEANGGRQPSGLRAADGTLWFPTQQGLAVFDPRAARENALPPPVVVEQVTTERRTIPPGDPIELAPGERRLEVRYTANTFVRPEGTRFRHRLEGLDEDWIEAGTQRVAQYSNVPPGHYVLTILAANSDGVWSPSGVSLPVRVEPFWWQAGWIRWGAVVFGAGALGAAYRQRVSSLKRRRAAQDAFARRLLESQEAERMRIASELHDGLGQTLVVIRNRAILAMRGGTDTGAQLTEIAEEAGDAIDDVRKIAYGLRPQQLHRLGLRRALQALVDQSAAAAGIPIEAEIGEIDGLIAREDDINVYRIVQEGMNNIVRHARATRARVVAVVRPAAIEMRIEDDGAGFDVSAAAAAHAGLGLTGIAERARLLGGSATVRSSPGQGTSVVVHFARRGVSSPS